MRHTPSLSRFRVLCLVISTAVLMPACVGEVEDLDEVDGGVSGSRDAGSGSSAPDAGGVDAGSGGDAGTPGGDAGTPSCSNISGDRQTQVCLRWKCDRANLSEGTWSGAVSGCNAGDLGASARAHSLRLINLYRFLAELPAVTTDAARDQKAQECALMMDANNSLNHSPPTSWSCYTSGGAEAAGKSNICSGRAVGCIDLYMADSGNATTLGHRRWFLSNQLGPVGIGGTPGGSCHWVIGGSGNANRAWTAWPPPGPVPLSAIHIPGNTSVDSTGWSVQTYSSSYNLTNAQVTVKDNGQPVPVTVTQLLANYGSTYAIRFNPQGWTTQAGHTYSVTITAPGVATPISYTVQPVNCP
jgi:hypothetical protein